MKNILFNALILCVFGLLVSCESKRQSVIGVASMPIDQSVVTTHESLEQTQCKSPRSEMCTREFRPVCATRDIGVRCVTTPCPSTERVTKSNACTACADEKVFSYIAGACS